jgi:hypothetical protein
MVWGIGNSLTGVTAIGLERANEVDGGNVQGSLE